MFPLFLFRKSKKEKPMKKKILSAILAALMLSSTALMTACSNNSAEENSGETTQQNTASDVTVTPEETDVSTDDLSDYEQRQLIPDNLPDVKYNGADYRVLTHSSDEYYQEIMADELTGDACNDAVFNRNLDVEERFDVKLSVDQEDYPYNMPKTMAQAGTLDYHLIGFYDYHSYTPITAEALLNWYEVPNVDLTKPWYNQLANDDATVNNRLYSVCSDLSLTSMTYTYSIFANIDLANNYGYTKDDLYALVKEGKWTIDFLTSTIEGMYIDTNGNGSADINDQYGMGCYPNNVADVWFNAFGGKVTGRDEEGNVTITFLDDKTVSMVEKLLALHYQNEGFYYITSAAYDEETWFLNQQLVFAPLRFIAAFTTLRDMETSYTMLPFPKWDEAQQNYYTNADDKFTVFGIATPGYSEQEYIGTIFEALSAGAYKKVYPEYYDTALKGKYSTDSTTAEMVELIMAGRMFDFSFQFGESVFVRIPYMIRDLIQSNNPDIASKYQSVQKAMQKNMERNFVKAYGLDE